MKVYISGQMNGTPDRNREAFSKAAVDLQEKGLTPVNPHDVCAEAPDSWTWSDYMREDIIAMLGCEAILMLPGWEQSKGACLEHQIAEALGFTFI